MIRNKSSKNNLLYVQHRARGFCRKISKKNNKTKWQNSTKSCKNNKKKTKQKNKQSGISQKKMKNKNKKLKDHTYNFGFKNQYKSFWIKKSKFRGLRRRESSLSIAFFFFPGSCRWEAPCLSVAVALQSLAEQIWKRTPARCQFDPRCWYRACPSATHLPCLYEYVGTERSVDGVICTQRG